MKEELTPKQERFIQNIVSGMTQRQAYKEAFGAEYDDNAIDINACKLFNETKVKLRYKELMDKLEDKAIMSALEKRLMLREMAKNINNSVTDRIKAIDTDNKMAGEYVTKVEGELKVNKLEELL